MPLARARLVCRVWMPRGGERPDSRESGHNLMMIEPIEPFMMRQTTAGEWQLVSRPTGTRFQPSRSPAFEDSSDLDIVGAYRRIKQV